MNARPRKFIQLWGLVLASLLVLAPTTPRALAVPRHVVEMGDPDIGNKPQSGPGESAVSPTLSSASVTKGRTSLWLSYLRLLISVRMVLR